MIVTWVCANGHDFDWGTEDWHFDCSQFTDDDYGPVPMYCPAYDCMDSSSLTPIGVR